MRFTRIGAEDLSDNEIGLMLKVTELSPFGYTPKDIIKAVQWDSKQLWRFDEGLMITCVFTHPGGRQLEVWGLAGRGVFREGFKADCWQLAKDLNCKWISAGAAGEGQARLYAKVLRIKPRGVYFCEEV